MSQPFFTVVIATFNASETLTKTLESVLQQSFAEFEIVIQDGGSTDDTHKIITDLNDPRIKLEVAPDHGIYDALNKAAARAEGKYALCLGADDYLVDNKVFEDMHSHIQQHNEPHVIYGQVYKGEGSGDEREDWKVELDEKNIWVKNACHQSIFYQTELLVKYPYNLDYKVWGDWHLNIVLFTNNDYQKIHVDRFITVYGIAGLSSYTMDWNFIDDKTKIGLEFFSKVFSKKKIVEDGSRFQAFCHLRAGKMSKALPYHLRKTVTTFRIKRYLFPVFVWFWKRKIKGEKVAE